MWGWFEMCVCSFVDYCSWDVIYFVEFVGYCLVLGDFVLVGLFWVELVFMRWVGGGF